MTEAEPRIAEIRIAIRATDGVVDQLSTDIHDLLETHPVYAATLWEFHRGTWSDEITDYYSDLDDQAEIERGIARDEAPGPVES